MPALDGGRKPVPDNCDTLWWDPIAGRCLCNSPACARQDTSRPIQLKRETFQPTVPGGNANGANGTVAGKKKTNAAEHPLLHSALLFSLLALPIFAF